MGTIPRWRRSGRGSLGRKIQCSSVRRRGKCRLTIWDIPLACGASSSRSMCNRGRSSALAAMAANQLSPAVSLQRFVLHPGQRGGVDRRLRQTVACTSARKRSAPRSPEALRPASAAARRRLHRAPIDAELLRHRFDRALLSRQQHEQDVQALTRYDRRLVSAMRKPKLSSPIGCADASRGLRASAGDARDRIGSR
jgi:hypothetical protein